MISGMAALSLCLAFAALLQGTASPAAGPRDADPQCLVRGVVVDLEAAPAAGIELTLTASPRPRRGAPSAATPLATTRSDASGAFELRAARPDGVELALVVTDPGWQDFAWSLHGFDPERPLDLGATKLARACDALVHLRGTDGQLLVEGWTIELRAMPEVHDARRRRAPPAPISPRDGFARFVRAPSTQCILRLSGPDGAVILFVTTLAPGVVNDVEVVHAVSRPPASAHAPLAVQAAPAPEERPDLAEATYLSALHAARSLAAQGRATVEVWVRAPETLPLDALQLRVDHQTHVALGLAPERPPAHGLRWLRGTFTSPPGPRVLLLYARPLGSAGLRQLRRELEALPGPTTSFELDTTEVFGVAVTLATGLPGEAAGAFDTLGVERTSPDPDGRHERRMVRNLAAQAAPGLPFEPRVVLCPGEYRVVASGPGWTYTGTATARVEVGDLAPVLRLPVPADALGPR